MSSHRIAIATAGRFHVLDLARELAALGHDVAFYSYVPRSRAEKFGLPRDCHKSLLPAIFPLLAAQRYGPRSIRPSIKNAIHLTLDALVAKQLGPCDGFVCMSGIYVEAARSAKLQYGAKVFLERGSRHILSQRAILEALPSGNGTVVPAHIVDRELAGYQLADHIVVPSSHVMESFLEQGVPEEKLFLNPYGVELDIFRPTPLPTTEPPMVIFAGLWSFQKGCHLLSQAVSRFQGGVRLLHIGPVGDVPLPRAAWFKHIDAVPQWDLPKYYSRAHVFALASLQEGLALVLPQALACGLPIVCTDRTGGEDIAEITGLKEGIFVIPHNDVEALHDGIADALHWTMQRFTKGQTRDILGSVADKLSWRAYGERYAAKLATVLCCE